MAVDPPRLRGFRMPAEWERHEATWLAWPYNPSTWEGHLEGAEQALAEIAAALAPGEQVHVLVPDGEVRLRAKARLTACGVGEGAVTFHEVESGDIWIRDYGPIFLVRDGGKTREVGFSKWRYNAYGGKYDDLLIGDQVPDRLPLQGLVRFDPGLVLEGGAIDVNGTGSLLTTESCLLSPDRNPHLTRAEIEAALKDFLNVTNVLWLAAGIEGDDTTGHVDDLTRFVGPATVVTAVEQDPADDNYRPLLENRRRLELMQDERGMPLTVIPLPMPRPFSVSGRRMAASYANFYVANEVVLVPAFQQPSDAEAVEILARCFGGRRVLGIDCRELIWGYGSIHCATQQQPAAQ